MLKTLIGRSARPDDRKTFTLYVISASFKKMYSRLRSNGIPKQYFDCLQSLKSTTFGFIEHGIAKQDSHRDQLFLEIIPHLKTSVVTTDITNLRQTAKEIADDAATPREIYNEKTYLEFHGLLCELLHLFRISLEEIAGLQKNPPADVEVIILKLRSVQILGRFLRAMVRSASIEKHLKTIEPLLYVGCGNENSLTVTTGKDDDDSAEVEEIESNLLKPYSIYKGQPVRPWQSYKDWLRLTILYFDAIVILGEHIRSLSPSNDIDIDIDIKILVPTLPNQQMMPWKELLRNEIYFPELPNKPEQISSEKIISFLTSDFDKDKDIYTEIAEKKSKDKGNKKKECGIDNIIRLVRIQVDLQQALLTGTGVTLDAITTFVDSITIQMNDVDDILSPGWREYTVTILDQLKDLKGQTLTPYDRLILSRELLRMLETLREHSLLYRKLKEGTPLSKGEKFSGTHHCETCLAGLCNPDQSGSHFLGAILNEFEVSHISCVSRMFV